LIEYLIKKWRWSIAISSTALVFVMAAPLESLGQVTRVVALTAWFWTLWTTFGEDIIQVWKGDRSGTKPSTNEPTVGAVPPKGQLHAIGETRSGDSAE